MKRMKTKINIQIKLNEILRDNLKKKDLKQNI
jgi:hypothetical protein